MMRVINFILLGLAFKVEIALAANCSAVGDDCNEHCDCCGYDTFPPIRCEKRNKNVGYKCYKSFTQGAPCTEHDDCRSHVCLNGFCSSPPNRPPPAKKCEMSEESLSTVMGTKQDNICNCGVTSPYPTEADAALAFDSDLSTSYMNDYALNGGFIFNPVETGPLRYIEICTAEDCVECDPTCYKLEGYCEETSTYELIQDGTVDLPLARSTCVKVNIGSRPLYEKYKLTFPCQRGTCKDTCGDFCRAEPVTTPVETCPGYVDDSVNNIGTLDYVSHSYDAATGFTTFIYSLLNIDVFYMALSWAGECSIQHYYVYEDVNGNKIIDTDEVCCFRKCGNAYMWPNERGDLEVCMAGLEIWSDTFENNPGLYLIQILVLGEITDVEYRQYGVYGNTGDLEYGQVLSPVCPDVLCPATCPLKLSEVNFMANCRDISVTV